MENYYEEILAEIEDLIKEKKTAEASFLLHKEMEMPYIPPDVEGKLKELAKTLRYVSAETKEVREETLDTLLQRLHGKPERQMQAAAALDDKNLRSCVQELQDYLRKDPYPEAAALVMDAIARQQIQEEFTYVKDGIEYSFYGDSLVPVAESEGVLKAVSILEKKLSNDHPDLFRMAKTLLIHKAYLFLPLTYEEEESAALADEVIDELGQLMGEIEENEEKLALFS